MIQIAFHKTFTLVLSLIVLLTLFTSCSSEGDEENISNENMNTLTQSLYSICSDWNGTPNSVSSAMTGYILKKSDDNTLIYVNRNNGQHVSFDFTNGHLSVSAIVLPVTDGFDDSMLKDGYAYIGDVESGDVFINKSDNTLATVWRPFDDVNYSAIAFTPLFANLYEGNETYGVNTSDNITVLPTRAEAYGFLKGMGGNCEVGFVYGLKEELPSDEVRTVNGTAIQGDFKLTLTGLLDDEDYYYRAYAIIDGVKYWGEVKSFHTDPLTYTLDGVEYKMIKVEGGPYGDFSIMQTELLPDATLTIGDIQIPFCLKAVDKDDYKITKYEFRTYLVELLERTGLYWRLPTTEEWMYAYQGGNKSKGYAYSGSNDIDEVTWYSSNSDAHPHVAASKKGNELGLFDMGGNYSELTNDFQIRNITKHQHNSINIVDIQGDAYGGNWESSATQCTKNSRISSPAGGTGSNFNAFDATTITVRLLYDRCPKTTQK